MTCSRQTTHSLRTNPPIEKATDVGHGTDPGWQTSYGATEIGHGFRVKNFSHPVASNGNSLGRCGWTGAQFDLNGNGSARGADRSWDRGAYEFAP